MPWQAWQPSLLPPTRQFLGRSLCEAAYHSLASNSPLLHLLPSACQPAPDLILLDCEHLWLVRAPTVHHTLIPACKTPWLFICPSHPQHPTHDTLILFPRPPVLPAGPPCLCASSTPSTRPHLVFFPLRCLSVCKDYSVPPQTSG